MGKFTRNGVDKGGTESEEFHEALIEAGSVECLVCEVKIGQGRRGDEITVCDSCIEYFCAEHIYRHKNCENGK